MADVVVGMRWTGLVLALALAVGASDAAAATKLRLLGQTDNVTPGATAFVDVRVPARDACRLESGTLRSAAKRIARGRARISWRVPDDAPAGAIPFAVRCARFAKRVGRSHAV